MPISKTPKDSPFPLRHIEELDPRVSRFCPLPTAANLRARKLFGIPLRSSLTLEQLTDETIEYYIKTAVSEIEHVLDLYITPVKFREKHDYKRSDFTWNYAYLKVDHPNILYVEKLELSFTNDVDQSGFVDFPLEHVHVMPQEGVVQLVPAFGTSLSGFLLSAFSGTQFHALNAMGNTNFPGGFRIEYVAGFDESKVPAAIADLIETSAAIKVLSLMGPILFPNNSVSVSIDGVSQGTSTYGVKQFNDRIDQLEKERERLLDAAKGYYQRRFLIDAF